MKDKNFIKKIFIYFFGNITSRLIGLILLPIYAFYTTSSELGEFDYLISISALISPIIFVSIWESVLKNFLVNKNEQKENDISTLMGFIILVSISVLIVVIISLILGVKYVYIMTMLFTLASSVSIIWQYFARGYNSTKLYVASGILSSVLNIILIIVFLIFLKLGLLGLFLAYLLSQISIIVLIEFKLRLLNKFSFSKFKFSILRSYLIFSLPLMLNMIALWLLNGFGRIITTNYFGSNSNGLIAFANKVTIPISMIGAVIIMALVEDAILTIKNNTNHKELTKKISGIIDFFTFFSILLIPLISLAFFLIRKTVYFDSLIYVPILILTATVSVMSSAVGSIFQAISKTSIQFYSTILGGAINVVSTFLMISTLGIWAVLIGQLLGMTSIFFIRYFMISKLVHLKLNWVKYIIVVVFTSLNLIFIKNYSITHILLLFIVTIALSYIINFKTINMVYVLIKRKIFNVSN